MRICLFCENRYAIDIVEPLHHEAARRGDEVLWFIDSRKITDFPLKDKVIWTDSISAVKDWQPEAVFVPGNIVPYYLSGVKVQIFHGYAAEKKDHWVIRRYFDMYLTQGPYFTEHFEALAKKYGDFEVHETGWTKQDWIAEHLHDYDAEREQLLSSRPGKKEIILYSPTFSPKLTSLPKIMPGLEKLLAERPDVLLTMKFHPLTRPEWIQQYRDWCAAHAKDAVFIPHSENITKAQLMADLVISDTSSAVYEMLLLDRPVVTLDTIAKDIYWEDITDPLQLPEAINRAQKDPDSITRRRWIRDNYDPHLDGQCCRRMLQCAEEFIARNGVPKKRKVNPWRRYTSHKTFPLN